MPRAKLTPAERERRKHERSAAKKNAKLVAEAGMFVEQYRREGAFTDAQREFWRWRRNIAQGGERIGYICSPAVVGLRWVMLQHVERFASTIIPAEAFARMKAHWRRTYSGNPTYGYTFWKGVLTGERVVFGWKAFDDPTVRGGRRLVEDGAWPPEGWTPPLTADEFYQRFPFADDVPRDAPDDGGLAARLEAIFARPQKTEVVPCR